MDLVGGGFWEGVVFDVEDLFWVVEGGMDECVYDVCFV